MSSVSFSQTDCDTCGKDVPSNEAFWSRNGQSVHCSSACLAEYEKRHPDPAYELEEVSIPPPSVLRRRVSEIVRYVSSFFPRHLCLTEPLKRGSFLFMFEKFVILLPCPK